MAHQTYGWIPQLLWKNFFDPGSGFLSGFWFLYFWWLYRKNFNARIFVMTSWFICHKIFQLVRGPVLCPVSGLCTSNGHIGKIPILPNWFWHVSVSLKFSSWSGIRFSVRFPVFVHLMVILEKFQCRWISFDVLAYL